MVESATVVMAAEAQSQETCRSSIVVPKPVVIRTVSAATPGLDMGRVVAKFDAPGATRPTVGPPAKSSTVSIWSTRASQPQEKADGDVHGCSSRGQPRRAPVNDPR